MKIIFGLGNPGEKYSKTRHNIGFILLDLLAKKYSVNFKLNLKFNSEIATINQNGEKILLCKPQTFMNNSGQAFSSLINYYKVNLENILVIQDEIDLPFSQIKFSTDSSSAGHKGIQSVINCLGTQKFKRARYGIHQEKNKLPTEMFVLKNFSNKELEIIKKIDTEQIVSAVTIL